MKKGTLLVLVALLLVSLLTIGCAVKAEKTFQLAETHPEDYPTTLADKEFARLVNQASGGKIAVEVFANKKLGEEKTAVEQVQLGAVAFTRVSLSLTSGFVPELDALQLPYLYRDADHMWKVLNGPIGQGLLKKLETANLIGLCYYDGGTRSFYTRKKVTTVADLRGMKIRVQQAPLMVGMVEALGAIATPLPYGDVYSALQTGTVDGAENNWPSYFSTNHFEHAKFYIVDEHTKVPELLMMSKKLFDALKPEEQALIKKAAADTVAIQIKLWNAEEKRSEEAVKAKGVTVTTISAEEKQKFMDAMQALYKKQPQAIQDMAAQIRAVK
ncbi:MAG: TRAP transporter substrate-binding protein [Spirochaetaceae bacterium]|nr:MAG: TRAP transporter substrate-binding protein [Spirochaetaceae bacterium]